MNEVDPCVGFFVIVAKPYATNEIHLYLQIQVQEKLAINFIVVRCVGPTYVAVDVGATFSSDIAFTPCG